MRPTFGPKIIFVENIILNGTAPLLDIPKTEVKVNELLDRLWQNGQYSYYWTTPDKVSHWFETGNPCQCPNGNRNVYFGVNPVDVIPSTNAQGQQRPPNLVRSQNNSISAVNCVFCEFDFKDWGTADKIKDHLKQFPFPSVVTFSGGGFHLFWLLADTFVIRATEDRERIRAIQANWVNFTDSDKQSKDLARVLRVPGTRNYKKCYAPNFPTVEIVKAKYSLTYTLDYLDQMSRPEVNEPSPLPDIPVNPQCDDIEWYRNLALNTASKMVRDCVDGEKHGTLLRAARLLGGYIAGGIVTEGEATRVLEMEIQHKPNVASKRAASRTIEAGIRYGLAHPITIEDKLREREQRKGNGAVKTDEADRQYWGRQYEGYWEKVR